MADVKIRILGEDQATQKLQQLDRQLDQTIGTTDRVVGSWTELSSVVNLGTMAFSTVMQEAQQVWALGKHGAAVEQTKESYEGLIKQLGVTPDLLDQLREASRGTVDDMTLMSSTLTLVAGAGEDLSREMLEASPRLLEIAKAANKLNPTLGSTQFLFESITSGIKRNSKLVLDNLGIIFNSNTAYSEYAEKIGKSVKELNDEEKALATLNKVAGEAGDNLLRQVGGSVDAVGDKMARLEVKTQNLSDELAKFVSHGTEPAASAFEKLVERANRGLDSFIEWNDALKSGLITREEYNDWMKRYIFNGANVAEIDKLIADRTYELNRAIIESSEAVGTDAWAVNLLTQNEEELTDTTLDAKEAQKIFKDELNDLKLFVAGPLGKELDGFEDKQDDLTDAMEDTRKKILELEGLEYLTDAQAGELDEAKKKMSELSTKFTENADAHDESTKRIMFNLLTQRAAIDGLTSDEIQFLNDTALQWGILDQATYDYVTAADEYFSQMSGTIEEEGGRTREELLKILGIMDENTLRFAQMGRDIRKIEGLHKVTIDVKVTGDQIPQIILGGKKKVRQFGGPVFPNEIYEVGERGREWFIPDIPGRIIPNYQANAPRENNMGMQMTKTIMILGGLHLHGVADKKSLLDELSELTI